LFTLISVDSHAGFQTLYITSTNTSYHIDQHIDRHLSQSLMVSEAIALVGTDQDGRRYGSKLTRKGSHCGRDSAQWLAYAIPCRRFTPGLAASDARLGADVDRYSFTVVDFHHLLLAGLPAHRRFELRCDAG
jgi:hypothetical protein